MLKREYQCFAIEKQTFGNQQTQYLRAEIFVILVMWYKLLLVIINSIHSKNITTFYLFVSPLHYPTNHTFHAHMLACDGMLKCLVLLPLIITSDIACIHVPPVTGGWVVKEPCRLQLFLVFHTPLYTGQFGRLLNDSLPPTLPAAVGLYADHHNHVSCSLTRLLILNEHIRSCDRSVRERFRY